MVKQQLLLLPLRVVVMVVLLLPLRVVVVVVLLLLLWLPLPVVLVVLLTLQVVVVHWCRMWRAFHSTPTWLPPQHYPSWQCL